MQVTRLLRIELTVADLDRAVAFYTSLPGLSSGGRDEADPAMAALLGAERIEQACLRRGDQTILLQQFMPAGVPFPSDPASCDQSFQHCALPVADCQAAARAIPASATPISVGGPQQLPPRSGGATAYKFRDPDGHPLELIQFPDGHVNGVDHSAIVSSDVERSIAFYRDQLGLTVASRQTNRGPEQDRLDHLSDTVVDVVALQPRVATPHIEILAYRSPPVRQAAPYQPRDIVATRLVLAVDAIPSPAGRLADGTDVALIRDPDRHLLLLMQEPA
ncbi:MAG: VOC family protein [Acetobacteraceae bacterium]|nr:VOC family protein [Acetobacteraceae bacterium]